MIAEQIKQTVTMKKVAEFYGFKLTNGKMCCPFHSDKTPSFKVYPNDKGWYCFGCCQGGDVISFAQRLFNLDFMSACKKLNDDFSLGMNVGGKRDYYAERKARDKIRLQQMQREETEKWKRKMSNLLCGIHREMWHAIQSGNTENPLFFQALQNIGQVDYYIDCVNDDVEDFKKIYNAKEVNRWVNMTGLKI